MGHLPPFLEELGKSRGDPLFVIADSKTRAFCFPVLESSLEDEHPLHLIEVPQGEANKNIRTCEEVWQGLMEKGADRQAVVLTLGGGMVGDLGGFCAATYKRGVRFVHIPTTLLAQVDASIGGKLGVDLGYSKNQVGVYRNPVGIFSDPVFLKTLPERELRAGFAEMVKHALIRDPSLWGDLKALPEISAEAVSPSIAPAMNVKNEVVREDPLEKGLRKVLNFGHTLGHALEAASYEGKAPPLLHGEAVALGMIGETWLSRRMAGLSSVETEEIVDLLAERFPVSRIPSPEEAFPYAKQDKKNQKGGIGLVLLKGIGEADPEVIGSEKEIREGLQYIRERMGG